LDSTVEVCIKRVGVDLKTASFALLRHVAGTNDRTARNVVQFRKSHARFAAGSGSKRFPASDRRLRNRLAGFLRIRGNEDRPDIAAVGSESYSIVEKTAASLDIDVPTLIKNPTLIQAARRLLDRFSSHDGPVESKRARLSPITMLQRRHR
jgi:uncharacterized protein